MPPWVQVLIVSITSVVASSGFWAYLLQKNNTRSSMDRLIMGLAYDKIIQLGLGYIERGWITKDEFEEYQKFLCKPYLDLGGNGVAKRVIQEVENLPLRTNPRYSPIQSNASR